MLRQRTAGSEQVPCRLSNLQLPMSGTSLGKQTTMTQPDSSNKRTTSYEVYGAYARSLKDPLVLSGRNRFQAESVAAAADDVLRKIQPSGGERLLEIGCNIGLILSRIAPHFERCIGQDHVDLLAKYRELGVPENVELFPGFWPETQPEGQFDCIVAYSVLQLVPTLEDARTFMRACYSKLSPGGRLLIGDVSNVDARSRFLASSSGTEIASRYDFDREQDYRLDATGDYKARNEIHARLEPTHSLIDDAFVMSTLAEARRNGFEAYVLPQPATLPFGNSREDILVKRRR